MLKICLNGQGKPHLQIYVHCCAKETTGHLLVLINGKNGQSNHSLMLTLVLALLNYQVINSCFSGDIKDMWVFAFFVSPGPTFFLPIWTDSLLSSRGIFLLHGPSIGLEEMESMLIDADVGSSTIVAAHVFQRTWDLCASTSFEDSDIDNVRNGLLLYKPVEWAMDRGKIYVGVDPMGSMRFHLLDQALQETKLRDHAFALFNYFFFQNDPPLLVLYSSCD